jgi:hypothetical protein
MIMTDEQRTTLFEEGWLAASLNRSTIACPYLDDETHERLDVWIEGYGAYLIAATNGQTVNAGQWR